MKRKVAAALTGAILGTGVVVASRFMPKPPPVPRMCTTQPTDGGVCIYLEPNHGTHLEKFAPGVVFPIERSFGQCAAPTPCPREP